MYCGTPTGDALPTFPGSRTFFRLFDHCGGSLAHTTFLATAAPDFYDQLRASTAIVALCIGKSAFYSVTGIDIPILDSRGYLYRPADCLPIKTRVFEQIGIYKSARKDHHRKGDPRMGFVTHESPVTFGHNLRWIIPTLDPQIDVQNESLEPLPVLKADISRSLAFRNPLFTPLSLQVSAEPPETQILTLDIETLGLVGSVERIGLASQTSAWSALWSEESRYLTQDRINKATIIQGHNLAFDIPRLVAEGIVFPSGVARFDTMLAQTLLHPRLLKGLEQTASIYLNIAPWKHLSRTDQSTYNALDAFYTHHLASAQREALDKTDQLALFTNTIMPATPTLIRMTHFGIRVDTQRLTDWQATLRDAHAEKMDAWLEIAPDINPGSPKQLARFLFIEKGFKPYRHNKTGPTTDEETLQHLIATQPAEAEMLRVLLAVKKLDKQLGTYAKIALSHDLCVHPNYLPATKFSKDGTTATGRLASTHPNIQNQPPEAKKLFIPHFANWLFVEFDFSQIELRIACALSNDTALKEALDYPGGVHARTMDLVGCDRVRAKNLIYGSLYGAGPTKLNRILRTKGIASTIEECKSLQAALSRAYPRLWGWRQAVVSNAITQRYLSNPFGRRRYFFDSDAIPEMYDYLPQSTAADILWSLLKPLEQFAIGNGGHFLTTTHDSGLFEFPAESITPALHQNLRDVCQRTWDNIAPGFFVPIEIKVGPNWGEMLSIT